eukprot:scaffold25343_cov166-Cylindrotheca_fusiformis.AAC.2
MSWPLANQDCFSDRHAESENFPARTQAVHLTVGSLSVDMIVVRTQQQATNRMSLAPMDTTAKMSVYEAPNIMICRPDENGVFPNDGFDAVAHGILVLDSIELKVFEFEQFFASNDSELSEPALSIRLQNISFVHFMKFRSDHGNYHGGQIRIIGDFVRLQTEGSTPNDEKQQLTIQMRLDEFARFKAHLKSEVS